MNVLFEFIGDASLFGLRVVIDAFRRPFEGDHIIRQINEVGYKSLVLTIASGLAFRDRYDLPSSGVL